MKIAPLTTVPDAPLGVMTNALTYDWHMTNLQNYISLSVKDVDSAKVGPVTLPAFGSGSGLHGMPGDFTPPARVVRAAIYSQSAAPSVTAGDAVLAAFHILNQFDIPKGSVVNAAVGEPVDEVTEWTSVADLKNSALVLQYRDDQSIHESFTYGGNVPTTALPGPVTSTFGAGDCHECSFASRTYKGTNYYLQVRAVGSASWDPTQVGQYSISLQSVTPGCPGQCAEGYTVMNPVCGCYCAALNMCPPGPQL